MTSPSPRICRVLCFTSAVLLTSFDHMAGAELHNGGFELGDFSAWTITIPMVQSEFPPTWDPLPPEPWYKPAGSVAVQSSFAGFHGSLQPFEGNYLLAVGSGENVRPLERLGHYDITASREISLSVGDSLSGWASFYNGDYVPQDSAWVRIYNSLGDEVAMPWFDESGMPSFNGVEWEQISPWTQWQWTALADDTYTLVLGASTQGDNYWASFGLHDRIELTAIPEPATVGALMGAASMLIMIARRVRQRRKESSGASD